MAIITLTTDFGEKDHFVGAVKGAIYTEMEDAKIVDISHSISPFHLHEAAYIIQNAYKSFPPGSIHVIGVDSELNPVVNNKESQIIGNVIYIDNYGNVISNITKKLFDTVGKGREFLINARSEKFRQIHTHYSDAINFAQPPEKREEDGKRLALWNSSQYLELAIYKSNPTSVGGASSLFGLEFRDTITVNFNS